MKQANDDARLAYSTNIPFELEDRQLCNKHGEIPMPSQRCLGRSRKGTQCKSRTKVGAYCWQHLVKMEGLRIKKSTIPQAGRGLFTARRAFKKNETVTKYTGDIGIGKEVNRRDSIWRNRLLVRNFRSRRHRRRSH